MGTLDTLVHGVSDALLGELGDDIKRINRRDARDLIIRWNTRSNLAKSVDDAST
jgi:hypothetical protein